MKELAWEIDETSGDTATFQPARCRAGRYKPQWRALAGLAMSLAEQVEMAERLDVNRSTPGGLSTAEETGWRGSRTRSTGARGAVLTKSPSRSSRDGDFGEDMGGNIFADLSWKSGSNPRQLAAVRKYRPHRAAQRKAA